jgi:hypothetical protein
MKPRQLVKIGKGRVALTFGDRHDAEKPDGGLDCGPPFTVTLLLLKSLRLP